MTALVLGNCPVPRLARQAGCGQHPGLLVLGAWLGGLSMTTTLVFVTVASQVKAGGGALGAVLGLPLLFPN